MNVLEMALRTTKPGVDTAYALKKPVYLPRNLDR